MQKQLSKQQQDEYNKIKQNQFTTAQKEATTLCLQYYLLFRDNKDYRQNNKETKPIDIPLAFKCAFFMAEKSQFSVNLKGEKVRGISFSLNKLLKDHKLDDTMVMLKQMIKKINMKDTDTLTYLSNIVKQISFLITLYSKFDKTFTTKLELRQRSSSDVAYTKIFTSYAWLLFITVKNQVLKRSLQLLPNTCMVAHIISFLLVLAWDYVRPEGLMRGDKRLNEKSSEKEIKKLIKQKVLEIFCIKDVNEYAKIATSFQIYFEEMIDKKVIPFNQDKLDFLSPQQIQISYKKLDKFYEQSLTIQHLDERIFFKERTMNLTPSKFTPFARQGYVNKYQKQTLGNKLGSKPSKQQTFNSHRVLNYEAIQKQIQTKVIPIQDIKLPKNIIQSPSMVKVPLVMATPISTGMEMYNYINEKKKRIKQINTQERPFDKNIIILIDKVFQFYRSDNDKINKQTKLQMIVALYKIFSQEYLLGNSFQKDTFQLMKAFLALSIQLVFFVSNISLTFQKIEQQLNVQPFQMWKAIDFFLKSDKSIPFPIKLHFLDLEVNLISFKLWQNFDLVKRISTFGNKSMKEMTETQINTMDKLFKRTIHQVAFQITRLTSLLQIDEPNSERIFEIMKEIMTNIPELIYKRHLDQLIICSIFATCKGVYKIMFNDIKECYMSSNPNLKDMLEDIIVHVHISDNQPPNDLITFYNSVFLKTEKLKQFIVSVRNNNGNMNGNKQNKKNALMMSPLKVFIPKEINFRSNMNHNPTSMYAKSKNNNMTPQTQLLYAYNQSPILKYDTKTFKPTLKSTRILTYDQQEDPPTKNVSRQQQQFGNHPTPSQNNIGSNYSTVNGSNYQATSDYISKKYLKKATTPTNQGPGSGVHSPHQVYNQQVHIPIQNLAKQNQNPHLSSNSHRTLFDEETKFRNKNYQFGAFRRQ